MVQHRAFELQPDLPAEGAPARAFYEAKFGGATRTDQLFARVTAVARSDGLELDFGRMKKAPNTRLAHRVVHLLGARGLTALDAFFEGHFSLGADLTQLDELLGLLERRGLAFDRAELIQAVGRGAGADQVAEDVALAQSYGIGGVPLFLAIDQGGAPTLAVSGAQPTPVLQAFLTEAFGA